MSVSRVVDVDIEISGDDHLAAVGGDDFQQRRQFFKELIRHRPTAGTVNDNVDNGGRCRF